MLVKAVIIAPGNRGQDPYFFPRFIMYKLYKPKRAPKYAV
jgi:hypothetical protein